MFANTPLRFRAAALALALAALAGCKPKIGDQCSTAIDCSALGDRLCDVTQPGGYCTLFNCQPDSCPDEAACVVFRSELDPSCKDSADGRQGRFSQSFCMRLCTSQKDCRDGYACLRPVERDARLLDKKRTSPGDVSVCLAVASLPAVPSQSCMSDANCPKGDVCANGKCVPGVCAPGSAEQLTPYKPPPTSSASATSSSASVGGAGGAGGAGGQGGVSSAGGI